MSVCSLTDLEELILDGVIYFPCHKVMDIVKSLPKLFKLDIPLNVPLEIIAPLKDYLMENNRTLSLNGGKNLYYYYRIQQYRI